MSLVSDIIRSQYRLEDDAARRLLKLLETARGEVRERVAAASPGSGTGIVLRQMAAAVEAATIGLKGQLQQALNGDVTDMLKLGIALAEAPLPRMVTLLRFALPAPLLEAVATYHAGLVTSVTEELRAQITSQIQLGILGGKPTPEIIKAIGAAGVRPTGPFKTAAQRAEAIARTELNRMPNLAADRRLKAAADLVPGLEKEWLTASDARVRPTHQAAHGQRVPVSGRFTVGGHRCDHPLDPVLPASETVHCVLPGAMIEGTYEAATRSFYDGEAVEIVTRLARRLSLTPNHPVATREGAVPAGAIEKGQQLLTRLGHVNPAFELDDVEHAPAAIEEIFEAFRLIGFRESVRGVAVDFHGDGEWLKGDIEVVWANGKLLRYGVAGSNQQGREAIFKAKNVTEVAEPGEGALGLRLVARGSPATLGPSGAALPHNSVPVTLQAFPFQAFRVRPSTNGDAGRSERTIERITRNAGFGRDPLQRYARLVATGEGGDVEQLPCPFEANVNASLAQAASHPARRDTVLAGEGRDGASVRVSFDEVVQVRRFPFRGHVYDLQSPLGTIIANGIYISNCRCRMVTRIPDED